MFKSIFITFISKCFVACCSLLLLIFTSRYLGANVRGEIALFVLYLSIIHALCEVYSSSALVHFIPHYSVKSIYYKGVLWCVGISFFGAFVVFLFYNQSFLFIGCLLAAAFMGALNSFNNIILLSNMHFNKYNTVNILQPLILFITTLISLRYNVLNSFQVYIYLYLFSLLVPFILSNLYVWRIVSLDNKTEQLGLKIILKKGIVNQFSCLTFIVCNRYSYFLISSAYLVGTFSNAVSLIESVLLISGSIAPLILSKIANNKHNDNPGTVFTVSKMVLIVTVFCIIILFFIPSSLFTFLFGQHFNHIKQYMLLLSPGIIALSVASIIMHYYSALGNQKIIALANAIGLIITLIIAPYTIKTYSIIGACWVSVVANLATSIFIIIYFMQTNKLFIKESIYIKPIISLLKKGFNLSTTNVSNI